MTSQTLTLLDAFFWSLDAAYIVQNILLIALGNERGGRKSSPTVQVVGRGITVMVGGEGPNYCHVINHFSSATALTSKMSFQYLAHWKITHSFVK